MRFYKNPQGKLGEINISEIKLDKKRQDDVPRIDLFGNKKNQTNLIN